MFKVTPLQKKNLFKNLYKDFSNENGMSENVTNGMNKRLRRTLCMQKQRTQSKSIRKTDGINGEQGPTCAYFVEPLSCNEEFSKHIKKAGEATIKKNIGHEQHWDIYQANYQTS